MRQTSTANADTGATRKRRRITCPYCFEEFWDDEVHFRVETIKEGDPKFGPRIDETYQKWWDTFGGISNEVGWTEGDVKPYERPVYDPSDSEADVFKGEPYSEIGKTWNTPQGTGMITTIQEVTGEETERRVCPRCHNPLPGRYGINEVYFISVIGSTGSGKTVYLSLLAEGMRKYFAKVGLTSRPITTALTTYIATNKLKKKRGIPEGTPIAQFVQPLFIDVVKGVNGKNVTKTLVFYDIAGENCTNHEGMDNFGAFIEHSHGIMFLIDSDSDEGFDPPQLVLNAIHMSGSLLTYDAEGKEQPSKIPTAICLSKGDVLAADRPDLADVFDDIQRTDQAEFNATQYNQFQPSILRFMNETDDGHTFIEDIPRSYRTHNYFMVTQLGGNIVKDGILTRDPSPRRIDEPLFWLLHQLGIIGTSGIINPPPLPPGTPVAEVSAKEKKPSFWGRLFGGSKS
jgi:hypothetical protein